MCTDCFPASRCSNRKDISQVAGAHDSATGPYDPAYFPPTPISSCSAINGAYVSTNSDDRFIDSTDFVTLDMECFTTSCVFRTFVKVPRSVPRDFFRREFLCGRC